MSEVVETKYRCNNEVDGKECGGKMKSSFNILDIQVNLDPNNKDEIKLNDKITVKLKYPEFSVVEKIRNLNNATDIAFSMIAIVLKPARASMLRFLQ